MFIVGMEAKKEEWVSDANTAQTMGSGSLAVYATPAMVALLEGAAVAVLEPELTPEQSSVGIQIAVEHLAATPLGKKVIATATITEVQGKKVSFKVFLHDEQGSLLGRGTHERVVINIDKFMSRL